MHLALGGCLGLPPIRFGLTADTGGHIAYVLGAAAAQAALPEVRKVSVVTRLFQDARLGPQYAQKSERIDTKTTIDRVATGNCAYLEKEALALDLPDLIAAFCRHLGELPSLPDVIHAHFSDAAFAAAVAQKRFAIPFVYTPHSLGINKCGQLIPVTGLDARIAAERAAIASADGIIVSTQNEADCQIAAYEVSDAASRTICLAPGALQRMATNGKAGVIADLAGSLKFPSKPIVLAIARPVRRKNLAALVRAFASNARLRDSTNLVMLTGQHELGTLSHEEREVIAELILLSNCPLLRGRVALPPRHNAADVSALYSLAASGGVFVNPALHEPFGLTLIEAGAAGAPVVATKYGGPADIVRATGHGLLVDPYDDTEIGAACLRIVSNRMLHNRFSRAGRGSAHLYSWSRYAMASVSFYAALHRRPRSHSGNYQLNNGPQSKLNSLAGTHTGQQSWIAAVPSDFVAGVPSDLCGLSAD